MGLRYSRANENVQINFNHSVSVPDCLVSVAILALGTLVLLYGLVDQL
jgi:hypothetical protein